MKTLFLFFLLATSILTFDKIPNVNEQIVYGMSDKLKIVTRPTICHNTTECQSYILAISNVPNVVFVNMELANECDYEDLIPYENILPPFNLFGLDTGYNRITRKCICDNLEKCMDTLCEMLNRTINCVRIGFDFY